MQLIDADACTLVLVDYQARLLPVIDKGADRLGRAIWLARVARALEVPVIGTEQNPQALGNNAPTLQELCATTLAKRHFDGCDDGLVDEIESVRQCSPAKDDQQGERSGYQGGRAGQGDIVIGGCEAHVCLMQTALGLLRAGYRVLVVADACGSRHGEDRRLGLRRLERAGATLVSVEMVAFEWLRSHEHARFAEILPMLRAGPDAG